MNGAKALILGGNLFHDLKVVAIHQSKFSVVSNHFVGAALGLRYAKRYGTGPEPQRGRLRCPNR